MTGELGSGWHSARGGWGEDAILTKPVSVVNSAGRRIAAYLDQSRDTKSDASLVILVPGYGRTKSSHLRLAYYLAINGLRVIRYDHSNHVGESDGDMLFTTLSRMSEDLLTILDFAEATCSAPRVGLVGESLGARVALKRASSDQRIGFFVSLIGIFDVQETLRLIYGEDGFILRSEGAVLGIRDIMGFQIDADRFIDDAYQHDFHSLETSMDDASRLLIPAFFFVAEKDPWVSQHAAQSVINNCRGSQTEVRTLPGIMHELYENPLIAASVCAETVRIAKNALRQADQQPLIRVPSEKGVLARTRLEKRASSRDLKTAEERRFWAEYLEKYSHIIKLQDYWNLLDLIGAKLGSWSRGEKILDAGCGIGNFGAFLLVHNLYQALQLRASSRRRTPWAQYVGVDFVPGAIEQAKDVHTEIYREFASKINWMTQGTPLVEFCYAVLDLNTTLPFKDEHFDKIVCNLVLSYLKDPELTLVELFRILKAGGRIVVSSIKPHADLSQIYRNYIAVSRTPEEREQARLVLNNASLIKYKEAKGLYQFFSESQLETMLHQAGCKEIAAWRSFGDQANVVVGTKS